MLFAVKDDFVNTENFANQAFMIVTGEILMIVFEYLLHELKLGSWDCLKHKSAVLCVIEK